MNSTSEDEGSATDAMSLGSNGSDYMDEEELDFLVEEEEEYYWDPVEPPAALRSPRLFTMIRDIRDNKASWEDFLDRLVSHPDEVHNHDNEYHPTILHMLIRNTLQADAVPIAVWNAILDMYPHTACIFPLPLYEATERMGHSSGLILDLDAKVFHKLLHAYPDAINMRHHFRSQNIDGRNNSEKLWPLYDLCSFARISNSQATKAYAVSCSKAIRILLEFCPEMALERKKSDKWERNNGMLPIEYIGMGKWIDDPNRKDIIWGLYLTILRGTCNALYSELNATDDETLDSFLLHTAVQFSYNGKAVLCLLDDMPHLARIRDSNGDYALALAAGNQNLPGHVLNAIMRANPSAASCPDRHGRLPLHIAAKTGFDVATMQCLLEAEPRALKTRDVKTHFYPFMFGAIGETSSIGAIYVLLRQDPLLASGLAEVPPWLKKRISEMEEERDDAVQREEAALERNKALAKENDALKIEVGELRVRLSKITKRVS